MATMTNARGEVFDLSTGKVVGLDPNATALPGFSRQEAPVTGNRAGNFLRHATWGLNSALFALPDAAVRKVGQGLGMKEDEVFQFTKYFNRGAVDPRNTEERYARAIGQGLGAQLPFTGLLGWIARARPLGYATKADAGALRHITDDMVRYVQKNPKKSVAIDMAFSAGYEGLRQAIDEQVDDSNPNKALYKELIPAAAFMGAPMAASMLPSVRAAKWVGNKITDKSSLNAIQKEIMDEQKGVWKLPGVRIVPAMLIKNSERKLEKVFGPLKDNPEAQAAIAELRDVLSDPRIAELGFNFDMAESSLFLPLMERKAAIMKDMPLAELDRIKQRINDNALRMETLLSTMAPEARTGAAQALAGVQSQRQGFFESLLRSKRDYTEEEILGISERLGPQNLDMLNDELRGAMLANMELDFAARRDMLSSMGLREAFDHRGLPKSTREGGRSLFPAKDMEAAALGLIKKYRPDRPSLRVAVPEPIRDLDNFVRRQMISRERIESSMVDDLTKHAVYDAIDLDRATSRAAGLPKDIEEFALALAQKAVRGEKIGRGKSAQALSPDADGFVTIPTGLAGRMFRINPRQIKEDAAAAAKEATAIDINVPEALDYLNTAMRYRNSSLMQYNGSVRRGTQRLTDAQRRLDTADAIVADFERLAMDHIPKTPDATGMLRPMEVDSYKQVIKSYHDTYSKSVPVLMTQRQTSGEFLLPNEELLRTAFKNAENLRQVRSAMPDGPDTEELLSTGALDWVLRKGVLTNEGLLDPTKLRRVLSSNRNIIDELPESVQRRLGDEATFADEYIRRMGEIDNRKLAVEDAELDKLLARAARPDADPVTAMAAAVRDPAIMRKLVEASKNNPEALNALRRSVWDMANAGTRGGGALEAFLHPNEKALGVLFKDTQHLADLKKIANLQRRIYAFAEVSGQMPEFQSLDQTLRTVMGSGVQYLTTTMREAAIGRIRPETGFIALGVRLLGGLENRLYERVMTKALEDPQFAHRLMNLNQPGNIKAVTGTLATIGVDTRPLFGARTIAAQTAMRPFVEGQQAPVGMERTMPSMPAEPPAGPPAREMLRQLPPAPPTTGLNFRIPTTPPAGAAGGGGSNAPMIYPALFPNDPISSVLMQMRQPQQGQPPQQIQQ